MALVGAAALFAVTGMIPPDAAQDGNHFYPGYCAWDAAEQAHRAWGVWVPWFGDAGDWIAGAVASGWQVSATPRVGSIVALPRGVQGSGPDGHVGWVLAVEPGGAAVRVRSMNWRGRGVVTLHRLLVDGRVRFLAPPARSSRLRQRPLPI